MTGIDSPVIFKSFFSQNLLYQPNSKVRFFIVESFVSTSEFLDNVGLIKLYENF